MIGGIVMSQSNLEKQEAKLKALNQKIKDEKQTTAYKSGMVIPKGGKVERTASGA